MILDSMNILYDTKPVYINKHTMPVKSICLNVLGSFVSLGVKYLIRAIEITSMISHEAKTKNTTGNSPNKDEIENVMSNLIYFLSDLKENNEYSRIIMKRVPILFSSTKSL